MGGLKQYLANLFHLPVDGFRVVSKGKSLAEDGKTLEECLPAPNGDDALLLHLQLKPGCVYLGDGDARADRQDTKVSASNSKQGPVKPAATISSPGTAEGTTAAGSSPHSSPLGMKASTILQPKSTFWDNLQTFLRSQFPGEEGRDASLVYERFRQAYERLVEEATTEQYCK